jgi:hypothetical protein
MRLGFVFFLLAVAIGYDAIQYDGAYTKEAWRHVREAGTQISKQIDRTLDRPPAEKTAL